MTEEEKKAIEKLKSIVKVHNDFMKDIKREFISSEEIKALEIALNLVENQQKELNNLKEIEKIHQEENGKLRVELEQEREKNKELFEQNQIYALEGDKINLERHIKNNYIRKDKVQEKIKEYEGLKIIDKQAYEEQIKPLKELWEDNNG